MTCASCGANLPDGSKFCPQCGTKIDESENQNEQIENLDRPDSQNSEQQPQKNNSDDPVQTGQQGHQPEAGTPTNEPGEPQEKKASGRLIGIIVAAVVVIAAIVVLIIVLSNGKTTVDLNKYLTITTDGYNGYGTASYAIEKEQLETDFGGKIKLSSEGKNNALIDMAVQAGEDPVELITSGISGSLNEYSRLSNGDVITFTWDVDESIERALNVDLKHGEYEYTVSGLSEARSYDIFNDVTVQFDGVEPTATAELSVQSDMLTTDDFIIENGTNLSTGDTVIVSITDAGIDRLAETYGIVPTNETKEYTADKLAHYITQLSEIPADAMDKMESQAEDILISEAAELEYSDINSIDFLGCYFLTSKSTSENYIYLAYKESLTTTYRDDSHVYDRYWYTCYINGMINGDGEFSIDYSDYTNPECTWDSLFGGIKSGDGFYFELGEGLWTMSFCCSGYETLNEMYDSVILSKLNTYNCESTVEAD